MRVINWLLLISGSTLDAPQFMFDLCIIALHALARLMEDVMTMEAAVCLHLEHAIWSTAERIPELEVRILPIHTKPFLRELCKHLTSR